MILQGSVGNCCREPDCREGEAPAEPRETSDFPHAHGSAGASPSFFQQAANLILPYRTRETFAL